MLLAATSLTSAAPAVAHPFGPPLAATVSAEGDVVNVRWIAAEDEWVILGEHLGVFSGTVDESTDSDEPSLTGAQVLAGSDVVHDYLLERIRVRAVGAHGLVTACEGSVERLEPERLTDGVELAFACPQLQAGFDVTVTTLMDVHDAYRVALSGVDTSPRRALLTQSEPSVRVTVGDADSTRLLVTGLVALCGVAGLAMLRTGRRRAEVREVTSG